MDLTQLVANAQSLKAGCGQLRDQLDQIIAQVSHVEQHQDHIATQAASPSALLLSHQLGSMASVVREATAQLQQGHPSLATAVAALTPTSEAAAAASEDTNAQQVSVATRRPYRQIHCSGQPPPVDEKPARHQLFRDTLAIVFGCLPPWHLTPIRHALGPALFRQSATNHTHISINCEDDHSRRMWEAMPIPVAHQWGGRASRIRQVKLRHPDYAPNWCLGTWVSVVEGHAAGRAALAADKEKRRQQGGGAAAAVDGGDESSDDEGTLEVLTFERVSLDRSIDIPNPPPSSDLPPAPSAPVRLPALTTVKDIPNECAAARVGRNWQTPNVKAFSHDYGLFPSGNCVKAWLADCCERLEVLISGYDGTAMVASAVSELPAGRSFSSLHILHLDLGRAEDTDRLREALVARRVRRQLRSLRLNILSVRDDAHEVEGLRSAVALRDAIANPAALSEPVIDFGGGRIDIEVLSRTTEPHVQEVLAHLVKTATTVTYDGHDEPHPAPISDDTFPAAHTLFLHGGVLATEDKKQRAIEVASHMPNLTTIVAARNVVPLSKVWCFLEGLQSEWVSRGEGERSVGTVSSRLAADLTQGSGTLWDGASPFLWSRLDKMPRVETVHMDIRPGDLDEDADVDELYTNLMEVVTSSTELKGHKTTKVTFVDRDIFDACHQRFLSRPARPMLRPQEYRLFFHDLSLHVERRTQ
mmetsp:Transcript_29153/g.84292  ORF Transcript_29153/g.84292 Transcript_29153/m.84292 type:complete len:700 (+) Transcript_29153:236-2335(+)